ncbi:Ecm25p NDAI_0K02940 [Naumovozyma dairenensis CBS 421]|uniref:Rho-GAP domain-containing protein n=1 Tax=Naumovozyma dairenensis (strain ATCC 10597 / BCRC 20456 / CBS 421 / NBRC 0211 / NRRL Y-12639) TaxID=1071378 RepID=G0WI74_NAUDC|nr:hypothetical protein NDAI_0K02940 [Naumovozyma dairenensis CBS 421]CCD27485.1 hypothetical protein NDAI_0K02940 [Naumovozyma dairenensis CBS 421]
MININTNNIFFKSYSIDPITGHSIYVFDSTYLPSPEEIGDKQVYDLLIDELMDRLITTLPSSPYSLVVFSSGFSAKKISWVYGIKMFSKIPREARIYLQKTYIVHESFFIRTVYQVLSNAMSINFLKGPSNKDLELIPTVDPESIEQNNNLSPNASIVHVPDLTALSRMIDITRLRISLNVYLHDYEITDYIDVPQSYFERLTSLGNRQYRQLIFDKIFKRLKIDSVKNELVFQKPGSYKKVNIFLDIIERNNYIDLSQWDIYSLASVFTYFLKQKSKPLIPVPLIPLPISDDFDYTYKTFQTIILYNNYYDLIMTIFPLFINILNHSEITRHDLKSLSKCLAPTLCQERVSMKNDDTLVIGARFIRNLLEMYDKIHSLSKMNKLHIQDVDLLLQSPSPKPREGRTNRTVSATGGTRIISQQSTSIPSLPPSLPKPRKLSPTKYDTNSSRSSSPVKSRTAMQNRSLNSKSSIPSISTVLTKTNTPSSSTSDSTPNLELTNETIPSLNSKASNVSLRSFGKPPLLSSKASNVSLRSDEIISPSSPILRSKVSNISLRINSDSSSTSNSNETPTLLKDINEPHPHPTNNVTEMVTDNESYDWRRNAKERRPWNDDMILKIELDDKFQKFDRELQKKRNNLVKLNHLKTTKFSNEGFSGLQTENKVSKLAALYEERLQGLQLMNEIKRNEGL